MKIYRLNQSLLALILLACLFGVQGQYNMPTYSASAAAPVETQSSASQYSQYYQMLNGPAPSNSISAPQQFSLAGNMPTTVLFSNQGQPVNYAQYSSSPSYTGGSSLWIRGLTSWTQYAVVPQGSIVNLLAITPAGGSGYLSYTDSNGQTYTYNELFYSYSRMTFYADKPGRHVFSFVVDGMVSNQVIIDVTGAYIPSTNYLLSAYYPGYYYPGYYSGFYPWNNYPWYYHPHHVQCGSGYHEQNGQCVPNQHQEVQCKAGYHEVAGQCVPNQTTGQHQEVQCKAGYHEVAGQCVPN
jgi:hypothetical protein